MNHLNIEAFLAVVRFGSITKAAKALFLSQSTVSQRLALLEKELDILLIERKRGTRSITLTTGGKRFFNLALKWEELINEFNNIKKEDYKPTLTIGAVDSVSVHVLGILYRRLLRNPTKLNLRVRTHQSSELYSLLHHGEIDIAFTLSERSMDNIESVKFFEERMVLIKKNADDISSGNKSLSNKELDAQFGLYVDWGPQFRLWHEKWWGTEFSQGVQLDTGELLTVFMNDPKYWTIVPVSMANNLKKTTSITIYFLTDPPPNRICYRVHQKSNSNYAIEFFDECLNEVENEIQSIITI